jgi:hypothetical protein
MTVYRIPPASLPYFELSSTKTENARIKVGNLARFSTSLIEKAGKNPLEQDD